MPVPKKEYLSEVWKDGIFDKKVVFCTGGNGTICSAQVRALVHLGADACIVGRNIQKTEDMAKDIATARKGAKVLGIGAIDVRSIQSLERAVAQCVKELGGLDFVIAGAAGNFLASIADLSANAMKSVVDIDVLGSYNTLKATMPHLISSAAQSKKDGIPGGRIIFITATFHRTAYPLQSHVSVAKAGVDALAASAAIELGPKGVQSNAIAPGPILATEGMERLSLSKDLTEVQRRVPSGRWGTVKDIADATVFLFSDAGSLINGEVIVVDGGAWRTQILGAGRDYPDIVDMPISGVKGMKKDKKAKL